MDRIEIADPIYSFSSFKLISADGKTAVTAKYIISNIHFNAPSQILKKEGNIIYHQLSEEDVGLIKESLSDSFNNAISPDGTLVSDRTYNLWHKDAEQGWQKEELEADIKVFNMAGNIAGGSYSFLTTPTLWIKDNQNQWQAKPLDNRIGRVWNLNSDGSIAVGHVYKTFTLPQENGSAISKYRRVPMLWTGENWGKSIDLAESINLENVEDHDALTINAKGDIVGGKSEWQADYLVGR